VSDAELLASVPLFAGLDAATRHRVALCGVHRALGVGAWLFEEGDPAESLFVVRTGRLEVLAQGQEPELLGVLGRGAVIGELAVLSSSGRSASVRARRHTELIELTRDRFEALLESEPRLARSVIAALGAQLQSSRPRNITAAPRPKTIALVALHRDLPFTAFAQRLATALGRWGTVHVMDPATPAEEREAALERVEADHDQVLLPAEPGCAGDWARWCGAHADRVVALAGRGPPAADPASLQGCDLVTLAGAGDVAIEALQPRSNISVGPGDGRLAAIADRTARRLAGRAVGVVLSGGGARGYAHIGAIEELLAAGVEIDRVGGCSMGAYIGAQFAAERSPDEIAARCRAEFVERHPANDYTLPLVSLTRGVKGQAMLDRSFGALRIEELPREYYCVSCDVLSSTLVVHRHGRVADAVGASMCLPTVFPPRMHDGRALVDGGVLDNLPVQQMALTGDGPVAAVDVTADFQRPRTRVAAGRPRARAAGARVRRLVTGADDRVPSFMETILRTMVMGSLDTTIAAQRHAQLVIRPSVGEVGLMAFDSLDRVREAGRRAAREALQAIPEWSVP
jgi:predicted acylesterase/phospholipase RssA/CRP-like cAMP-binding protein